DLRERPALSAHRDRRLPARRHPRSLPAPLPRRARSRERDLRAGAGALQDELQPRLPARAGPLLLLLAELAPLRAVPREPDRDPGAHPRPVLPRRRLPPDDQRRSPERARRLQPARAAAP